MAIDGVGVDEPFYFSSSGSTDEAVIQIAVHDLEIKNTYDGANILMKCDTIGGGTLTLAKLDPDLDDGGVFLANNSLAVSEANNTVRIECQPAHNLYIVNASHGYNIQVRAEDAGGTSRTLADYDPDKQGVTFLSYGGAIANISGDTDALDVKGVDWVEVSTISGNVTIGGLINGYVGQTVYITKTNSANTLTIEHSEATGNQDIITQTGADMVWAAGDYGGCVLKCTGSLWRMIGGGV